MSIAQLTQSINLQITGQREVADAIRRVTRSIDRMSSSFERNNREQKKHRTTSEETAQGLYNIQAGLVQLSTWLLNTNVKINNLFDNMTKRFTESQTAMTQLKITMGLAGQSAEDPMFTARFAEFDRFRTRIDELAMSTEFTKKQVADAFRTLVTSGRSGAEAISMLNSTLQLATASGGDLDLKDSVEISTLTLNTLGGEVTDVSDNLNMLLRTSQKTKIGFKDLQQTMSSMRGAFTRFGETEGVRKSSELMVMAAALKAMGESGAKAGLKIDQFTSTINSLVNVTRKGEMRKGKGLLGKGRLSLKREDLLRFFGVPSTEDQEEVRKQALMIQKRLGANIFKNKGMDEARDLFVRSMFIGKGGKSLGASEILRNMVEAYNDLVKKEGGGVANAIVEQGFGQKAGVTMLQGIVKLAKDAGKSVGEAGQHYLEYAQDIERHQNDLTKAQLEASKTLAYRIAVVESAQDALSNSIFKHDVYANSVLDTYKETLSALTKLMKNNKSLAVSVGFLGRMMQFLTGVGTNLGFMLVATATFSMAVTSSLKGANMATIGLGQTLRTFGKTYLYPTFFILSRLAGGIALLSVGVVALMRYFSGAQGIGEGFRIVLDKISDSAKTAGGLIQLAFSKEFGTKSLDEVTKKFFSLREQVVGLEQEIFAHEMGAGILTENQYKEKVKQHEKLANELIRINDVLGLEGRKVLGKMQVREGGKETVSTIAQILQGIKNLASGLMIIGESAILPVMQTMGFVFSILKETILAVTGPIRYLATLFGYASDEGSFFRGVLEYIGYALGIFLSYLMVTKTISLFVSSLKAIGTTFTSLKNRVVDYNNSANAMQTVLGSVQNNLRNQIPIVDRVRLEYLKATKQTEKFSKELAKIELGSGSATKAINKIGNTLKGNLSRNLYEVTLTLGGTATAVGGLFSIMGTLTGNEAMESFGNWTTMIGMGLLSLGPIIQGLGALINAFTLASIKAFALTAVAFLATWGPILLAIGVLMGTIYLLFSLNRRKTTKSSVPKKQASLTQTGQTMAASRLLPAMQGDTGSVYTGGSGVVSPTTNTTGMVATAPNQRSAQHVKNDYSKTVNIKQVILKALDFDAAVDQIEQYGDNNVSGVYHGSRG